MTALSFRLMTTAGAFRLPTSSTRTTSLLRALPVKTASPAVSRRQAEPPADAPRYGTPASRARPAAGRPQRHRRCRTRSVPRASRTPRVPSGPAPLPVIPRSTSTPAGPEPMQHKSQQGRPQTGEPGWVPPARAPPRRTPARQAGAHPPQHQHREGGHGAQAEMQTVSHRLPASPSAFRFQNRRRGRFFFARCFSQAS
mgnify:CR=1 FL=1